MIIQEPREITSAEVAGNAQIKFYQKFARDKTSWQCAAWGSQENQMANINEAVKLIIRNKCTSVLDVGSGVGELYNQLVEMGQDNIEYRGIDITPRIVERAKEMNPKADIRIGNIFELKSKKKFDAVIACGTFNLHREITIEQHKALIVNAINIMDELANKVLFVSLSYVHGIRDLLRDIKGLHLEQRRGWNGDRILDPKPGDDWFITKLV